MKASADLCYSSTFAVLDSDDIIVMVMVGKPVNITPEKSLEWDIQSRRYATNVERLRKKDERPFAGKAGHHSRGDYATVTFGVSYGGGRTVRIPFTISISRSLLPEAAVCVFKHIIFSSSSYWSTDALEFFFPLAHEVLCERMRELHLHHPHLRFPFKNSVYPACTMNCGPQSVSFLHADGPDYPGIPGSIHAFGSFNPKHGGHLIAFDLKLFIQFPSGTLSLLSSSGMRHGNTPIQSNETRYSFTQYVSGHLIKWVAYGCRPAGQVGEEEKQRLDEVMREGWHNQRARLSNFFRLNQDRLQSYMRRESVLRGTVAV
ncbi:hypothetical protein PENSPDRAFT_588875 [Peniophora sp. CONT]|nr:hypothetical protein PENSPDRAFT_588875 [Peniophora sp. CONT]